MSLDSKFPTFLATVPECVAGGYVDISSGMLLAVKTVDSHPQDVIALVAAATADLFAGQNITTIEQLFRRARGVQDNGHHYFQEIIVNSDNLLHIFIRGKKYPDYVTVFGCPRVGQSGNGPDQGPDGDSRHRGVGLTMAAAGLPTLELNGYGALFGARVVLADVSCSLPADGLDVLMGPVKTGKSTLMRSLAGLNDANRSFRCWGTALLDGQPVGAGTRPLLVQQKAAVLGMSVRDALAGPVCASGSRGWQRAGTNARARPWPASTRRSWPTSSARPCSPCRRTCSGWS